MRDLLKAIKFVTNYRVALDVGACVGFHTRILETIFRDVIAVEPDPTNVECLNKNIHGELGTIIIQAAMSDKCIQGSLTLNTHNCGGHRLVEDSGGNIDVLTIDTLRLNNVDFIKIDVEGMEKKVLIGAKDTILRCKPIIYVENSVYGSLDKYLGKLKYRRVHSRNLEEVYAPNS